MAATITQPPRKRVLSLVLTWINGNLTDVVDEILGLPTADAVVMTNLLTEQFQKRAMRSDGAVLRRILEARRR